VKKGINESKKLKKIIKETNKQEKEGGKKEREKMKHINTGGKIRKKDT
jgi:hypothetical protein